MKLSNSRLGVNKILVAVWAFFVLLTVLFAFCGGATAQANAEEIGWSVSVRYYDNDTDKYIPLGYSDTYTKGNKLIFLIAGYGSTNEYFDYLESDEPIATQKELSAKQGWLAINASNDTTYLAIEEEKTTFLKKEHEVIGEGGSGEDKVVATKYYYFRRNANGKVQYYADGNGNPIYWLITINTINASENVISNVTCVYSTNGQNVDYTGEWIATPVTFTVTTDITEANNGLYDTRYERLSYSKNFQTYYARYIEQGKTEQESKELAEKSASWIALDKNTFSIAESMNSVYVWVRLTDITGGNVSYARYDTALQIDAETPFFSVTAKTKDANGNEIDYSSRQWACDDVVFTFSSDKECISGISFEYSDNGVDYQKVRSDNTLEIDSSKKSLKFRSVNGAKKMYVSNFDFVVNIDPIRPQVSVNAFTIDPDLETATDDCEKELLSTTKTERDATKNIDYTYQLFGSANDKLLLNIYNRDSLGAPVENLSSVTFYYERSSSYDNFVNSWQKMTLKKKAGTENYYYFLEDINDPTQNTSGVKATHFYRFKIVSEAGLESDIFTMSATVVKSIYSFNLAEDYLIAEVNSTGWIADKAIIRTVMQTDSKKISAGLYSEPTTEYWFYYWPQSETLAGSGSMATRIKTQATRAKGEFVSFYSDENGVICWLYQFELRASAKDHFNIRAMNSAGKLSAISSTGEVTTFDEISIDVLEPVTEMEAYIYPVSGEVTKEELKNIVRLKELSEENKIYAIDVDDPGWVNGSIYLVIAVKVGVSDVYLKNMNFVQESSATGIQSEGIWLESDTQEAIGFDDREGTGKYYYFFSLSAGTSESNEIITTVEYRYRVYTGSGISKDLSFTANFDTTSSISIDKIAIESVNKKNTKEWKNIAGTRIISDDNFALCEDYTVTFDTSIDRLGVSDHYSLYYYAFSREDIGVLGVDQTLSEALLNYAQSGLTYNLMDEGILGAVGQNEAGVVYYAVYVVNNSRGYMPVVRNGVTSTEISGNKSDYYIIKVEYDTRNIEIVFSIDATDAEQMESGKWSSGSVGVTIILPTDIAGDVTKTDDSYTFYYMLIYATGLGKPTENYCLTEMAKEENWIVGRGSYDSEGNYSFSIPFTKERFYGVLGLSVCNKAGYRSKSTYSSSKVIRIDNTSPDFTEIIYDKTGEIMAESDPGRGVDVISIYSSRQTYLDTSAVQADYRRSLTTFYYRYYDNIPSLSSVNTGEMEKLQGKLDIFSLSSSFSDKEYTIVYLILFAHNEVATGANGYAGTNSWSTGTGGSIDFSYNYIYAFVYDPSKLTGATTIDQTGSEFDDATNMYSYYWQETVSIGLSASRENVSATMTGYVKFQFSVDDGKTWYDYREAGSVNYYDSNTNKTLSFSADSLAEYQDQATGKYPFKNGVTSAFKFRAVNKAGSTYEYEKIYIAIDETTPVFEVNVVDHNGQAYSNQGSLTDPSSSDNLNWTSGPLTVMIKVIEMPRSGISVTYSLNYRLANGSSITTEPKVLNNYTEFSTDMLDGFNTNLDAILILTATNLSKSTVQKSSVQKLRLSVDQVVPVFTMSGEAKNNDGKGGSAIVYSGDWTNYESVEVFKQKQVENVSPVTYTYTWKDANMAEPSSHVWSGTEGTIKKEISGVLTVTATTGANLKYTQTFEINIDTIAPEIKFNGGINVIEGQKYYIDLQVAVDEANIEICEYITVKTDKRGFAFDPSGYVLSTSSVDNSTRYDTSGKEYRGYVRIYVKDYAGNSKEFELYILPFALTVNNITLSEDDRATLRTYEEHLGKASGYMEDSRISYFENLIKRLKDRISTLEIEIASFQNYLEDIANRSSYELRSDYDDMFKYYTTFQNYEIYGQKWIQTAITGDSGSKYYDYYQTFYNQFQKLKAQKEQVEKVEADITSLPAINMVETEDYDEILIVYDEYYDLTEALWSCLSANLENKLFSLKSACEVLLLQDKETGVKVDGSFAPGTQVKVNRYDSTTETYQNAQKLLLNNFDATLPRAIVSIFHIGTDGAHSQTVAGDVEIEIPIDEEYQNYIDFAVYELSDDGSMVKLSGTEVQAKGETILVPVGSGTFGGTYVLCVKADIKETETTEGVYGSLLGLELDAKMIRTLLIAGIALFAIVLVVCVVLGIRHRRFLNSYNRAYRNSIYKRSSNGIPKGNKMRR